MKIVVQIPCYNEEKTIGSVVKSVPKRIGKNRVSVVVIDDGSTDNSAKVAKKAGANLIIQNKKNLGLAKTFRLALELSLSLGADVIINTDADNQYDQKEISKLIKPIIEKEADMVVGNRQVQKLNHMPLSKKVGNMLGSYIIRLLSGSTIQDASSGFRAFSRSAAESFNLTSTHTYTHETIIQAVNNDLTIVEIPINFKKRVYGESRLIGDLWTHVKRSGSTIIRTILMYKAFKYFLIIGVALTTIGLVVGVRFIYFVIVGDGRGHTQSLILSSILISLGINTIFLGFIADLIAMNRKMVERIKND